MFQLFSKLNNMESILKENQVSKPINIPKNIENQTINFNNIYLNEYVSKSDTIQIKPSNIPYSLKENFFDPNKSSPPNFWSNRLLDRFSIY